MRIIASIIFILILAPDVCYSYSSCPSKHSYYECSQGYKCQWDGIWNRCRTRSDDNDDENDPTAGCATKTCLILAYAIPYGLLFTFLSLFCCVFPLLAKIGCMEYVVDEYNPDGHYEWIGCKCTACDNTWLCKLPKFILAYFQNIIHNLFNHCAKKKPDATSSNNNQVEEGEIEPHDMEQSPQEAIISVDEIDLHNEKEDQNTVTASDSDSEDVKEEDNFTTARNITTEVPSMLP